MEQVANDFFGMFSWVLQVLAGFLEFWEGVGGSLRGNVG